MHPILLLVNTEDQPFYLERLDHAGITNIILPGEPAENAEIIFGEPSLIKDVLQTVKNIKWVQATWAGVEPLLGKDMRKDYILTNARGVFGGLMSEYVFGYLLFRERRILERLKNQTNSIWDHSLTGSLRGKSLGLLGVGSIGSHIAKTGKHFGMKIRGYTFSSENCMFVDHYFHGRDIYDFAEGLDVLVSVLPNTQKTKKIVDSRLLEKLTAESVFINAGRGSAVDERALILALNTGKLGAAILDVFEQEPLPKEHPFWKTKNLIISSHSAAPSFPGDLCDLFINNYFDYLQGKPLKYVVDFEKAY
ncbi:MAG: D-2-hydroxyacid dehydrogenase [Chloroflexota bacterium]